MTRLIINNVMILLTLLVALQLISETTAQYDSIPGMEGMGGNQKCKTYSCSKGYAAVPKRRMKFTSAGCDAMGGGAMMFGGLNDDGGEDKGKPYESCCDEWHACFQICGTSKQSCDDTFKKCVDTTCDPIGKSCHEGAKMTIMMMSLGGCNAFDVAQSQACECTSKQKDGHVKKREESLAKFYKTYAPDSIHKVPDLMKKADTSLKLANLLKKLVHKYPECIEKVEDPQQKKYRDMMNNAKDNVNSEKDGSEEGDGGNGDDEDIDDFDVEEDLGSNGEEEEKAKEETPEKEKEPEKPKERKSPPPKVKKPKVVVEEKVEQEPEEDEFNQYQEL